MNFLGKNAPSKRLTTYLISSIIKNWYLDFIIPKKASSEARRNAMEDFSEEIIITSKIPFNIAHKAFLSIFSGEKMDEILLDEYGMGVIAHVAINEKGRCNVSIFPFRPYNGEYRVES